MNWPRIAAVVAYGVATAGLIVLAYARNGFLLHDEIAITVLAAIALGALLVVLVTGRGLGWLFVGGVWTYATVIATWRAHSGVDEDAGLGLIFGGVAVGVLACYVAWRREVL